MSHKLLKSYAKINWCIDVLGKRPDGYHDVAMVMQLIDLYDRVHISLENRLEDQASIVLTTNRSYLPTDQQNLAYQAAALIQQRRGQADTMKDMVIRIHIDKRIPVAAGLAGGSSDAAAVLLALNKMGEPEFSLTELYAMGKELGADVPFCLMGQIALSPELMPTLSDASEEASLVSTCAIAEGIGEELTPITGPKAWIVLSKPTLSVSTAKVYGALDLQAIPEHPDIHEMLEGINENNFLKVKKNMVNVLENAVLTMYPVIVYTKNKMEEHNPIKVLMSGSGPTVYGVFRSRKHAYAAYCGMKAVHKDTYLIRTKAFSATTIQTAETIL